MKWAGRDLETIGDLTWAMDQIANGPNPDEEAAEFMALYRAESEHANENIGYLTGYYEQETASRLRDLFDVSHPIFGRTTPTVDEALVAGRKMAEGMAAG